MAHAPQSAERAAAAKVPAGPGNEPTAPHAVDRRFNRARYDADQMVAAFASRLKDAVDLDTVRDDLAHVVTKALEPAHIGVWVKPG